MSHNNTNPSKKFCFTHPNKAINSDLFNSSALTLNSINSLTDEESLADELKDSVPSLGSCSKLVSSDLALRVAGSHDGRSPLTSHNSSGSSDGTLSSDVLSLMNTTKDDGTPLFTESFEDVKSKTIYTTDADSQGSDVDDVLSLITGTTISQILSVDKFTTESYIPSAIKRAEEENIDIDIHVEGQKNSLYLSGPQPSILKCSNIGCSKVLEKPRESKKFKKKVTVVESIESKKILDVKKLGNSSKVLGQLLFTSIIKYYKEAAQVKFVSEKQLEKHDIDTQKNLFIKYRFNIIDYLKALFNSRPVGPYEKAIDPLFRKLTIIFSDQKLYYDVSKRGLRPIGEYEFRSWRMDEYVSFSDTKYVQILKGDGCHQTRLAAYHDFKIVNSKSACSWTKDQFEPIVVFPDLKYIVEYKNSYTLINYYSPLLDIFPPKVFESKKVKYQSLQPSNLGDILNAKPPSHRKKLSKLLWLEVREYVYGHYDNIHFRKSDIKRVEVVVQKQFIQIVDAAVNGYIEAFNYMDGYSTLDRHGSHETYVKIFEFYRACPIVDLGFYLLQIATPNILNRNLFKLRAEGKRSLEIIEIVIQNNLSNLDSITLSFLRLMVAFIQSSYITKFILRKLMYWGDNIAMNPVKYAEEYNWFKDPKNFTHMITTTVRDDAISFIEKRT